MRSRALLLVGLAALAGAAMAMLPALAVAASEAKLEVNGNCIENGWPCWAASGSGPKPAPARSVTIAAGGEVMFSDNTDTSVNIAWMGAAPTCSSGVPVSPASPQTDWEGRCKFEQSGTYRFESSTLFKDESENFTKYEILVEGGTTVKTTEAMEVTQNSATLKATVNPNGEEVSECKFEYGTTASYGSSVSCSSSPGSGTTPVQVSAALEGLARNTTYHFRISATNEGGRSNGADETFTTLATIRNPPEFGRCEKVPGEQMGSKTVYHGQYSNSVCTKASPEEKGKYEWFPGVEKTKFKATSKGKVLFETVDGKKISCMNEEEAGEYATPKLEKPVVFTFKGCDFEEGHTSEHLRVPASSEGRAEGEIVTEPTECELGVGESATGATQAKGKLALTCAEEQEFMWFKWKAPIYGAPNAEPEMCITGWWLFATKANSMSMSAMLTSTQSKGKQKLVKIVESPLPNEDLEYRLNRSGSFEQMGLTLSSTEENEEPVEANAVA